MNHEQAFLADILDHPDDDAPRLIFADWLEDADHPERAELIRVQIQANRIDEFDPQRQELLDREHEILARHRKKWLGPLADLLLDSSFRRGVLEHVRVRAGVFAERPTLFQAHMIRELDLVWMAGEEERVADIANNSALSGVESLYLSGSANFTSETFAHLFASPHLKRLRHLGLYGTAQGSECVAALVNSPVVPTLVSLDLTNCSLRADAIESLAAADLPRLRKLRLASTRLTPAGVGILTASRRLPPLTSLDLCGNHLPASAAKALAGCPRLADLRELNLDNNDLRSAGGIELARSPHLRRLERLGLASNNIGTQAAIEFGKGNFLDHMNCLELAGNHVKTAGVRGLTNGNPTRLEYLLLGTNNLDDDALRALARWPALATVRELNLYNNEVTAFGMRGLIDSPHLRSLHHLNLDRNQLKDLGAEVLAVWEGLANVRWLKLRANVISDRGAIALARSPHLKFMTNLDLSANDVSEEAKAAFMELAVRARVRRVAPWDVKEVPYLPPLSPLRQRG